MDESFIYERLKALGGSGGQSLYRDISKAFEEVVRYNKDALEQLKQQLDHEIRDVSERFYLYGAVARTGDAPMVNDFLFPMDEGQEPGSIATVFCQCPLSRMKEIFTAPQELVVGTKEGETLITAQVKPCRRYLKKIEGLKKVYYENGIYWRTPYLPYVGKFGDVFCRDFEAGRQGGGPILSVRFKDGNTPAEVGMVPLWNVEPIRLKCTVFPVPAIDEQNYRHTLKLPFAQDGYVVRTGQAIKNVYVSEEGLELITEEKLQKEFGLLRIAVKRDINVPHYPLTSNYRQMRHIDRQADHAAVRLMTRAEIARIVTSYGASRGLELVKIVEGASGPIKGYADKYGYVPAGREGLLLGCCAKEAGFLAEDQVSFLVEEIQGHFPQFSVTGELTVTG